MTTRMPPRDLHLRSGDFLDVKAHPVIAISADSVSSGPDGEFRVLATFDIRGHLREVGLLGHLHGGGQEELVFHVTGELDRHDFGIHPRQPFEMVVGRRVVLDVELVLAPDEAR